MQVTRIVQKGVKGAIPEGDLKDLEGYKNNRRTGEKIRPSIKALLKRYIPPDIH